MKRKITYLLKDFDNMIKEFLINSENIRDQVNFLKQREYIFDEIDKMCKKYDKIIKSIKEDSELENET